MPLIDFTSIFFSATIFLTDGGRVEDFIGFFESFLSSISSVKTKGSSSVDKTNGSSSAAGTNGSSSSFFSFSKFTESLIFISGSIFLISV